MALPELVGSDKQVAWAEKIRNNRLKVWQESDPEAFEVTQAILFKEDQAAWWITYRERSLNEVIKHITYGVKWKNLKEKKHKEQKKQKAPVEKTAPTVPMEVVESADSFKKIETDTGFHLIGPTRDMLTGEVVEDDSLPF